MPVRIPTLRSVIKHNFFFYLYIFIFNRTHKPLDVMHRRRFRSNDLFFYRKLNLNQILLILFLFTRVPIDSSVLGPISHKDSLQPFESTIIFFINVDISNDYVASELDRINFDTFADNLETIFTME